MCWQQLQDTRAYNDATNQTLMAAPKLHGVHTRGGSIFKALAYCSVVEFKFQHFQAATVGFMCKTLSC